MLQSWQGLHRQLTQKVTWYLSCFVLSTKTIHAASTGVPLLPYGLNPLSIWYWGLTCFPQNICKTSSILNLTLRCLCVPSLPVMTWHMTRETAKQHLSQELSWVSWPWASSVCAPEHLGMSCCDKTFSCLKTTTSPRITAQTSAPSPLSAEQIHKYTVTLTGKAPIQPAPPEQQRTRQ